MRGQRSSAGMAETVRSLFDYREPPTLDSNGESSKPPQPRGRGCGRKRKGTPVKVCDRVFATEDEEESMSENSYGPEKGVGHEDKHRVPAADGPYYETQSAQLCVSEEGSCGGRGALSYPPPPNCRIREVHCGNQVRLIVIAIRDIAKGEEITVDYSLTEWGENALGFHGTVPPSSFDCSSDHESNIKKEEESGPVPLSASEYLTPSWSLSPSSSPLSHSEPSDSDLDSDDANGETRMRTSHRRKRHNALSSSAAHAKRKALQRPPSHPLTFPHSLPSSPVQPAASSRPVFKCPLPAGVPVNSVNVSEGRGQSTMAQKQRCVYCGRHFRSLARHLDKHHAHQPGVRSALEQAHTSGDPPCVQSCLPSSSKQSQCPQVAPVPGVVVGRPQSPPSSSLSPVRRSPALSSPTRKSPAPVPATPPRRGGVPVSVLKRSPPTTATPPRKGGRKIKKDKEEVNIFEKAKEEELPTPVFVDHVKDSEPSKEEREDNGGREEESGAEDKTDLSSLRRPHMLPLLSSLSSLVLYLRRLQHSAFISLPAHHSRPRPGVSSVTPVWPFSSFTIDVVNVKFPNSPSQSTRPESHRSSPSLCNPVPHQL
ncbi:hypothetical protein QQF64_000918 [Cirrhinus molitorella]|uniref:SET domain-containing protein n=1 Tax=Cirrhinus molitorella TaxID=172907 RepID=A0ABR3P043_9TELE